MMANYPTAPGADPFETEWAGWAWGWTAVTLILLGLVNAGVWYEWLNGNPIFGMSRCRPYQATSLSHDMLGLTATFAVLAALWTTFTSLGVVKEYWKETPNRPDFRDSSWRYSDLFMFAIPFMLCLIVPLIGLLLALFWAMANRRGIRALVISYREGCGRPLAVTMVGFFLLWQGTPWAWGIANAVYG